MCIFIIGSRDGAVLRALTSHQCGPLSIPGPCVICRLSLLLVLILAPRDFLRVFLFSLPPQKSTFLKSNSIWEQWMKSHFVEMSLQIPILLFYFIQVSDETLLAKFNKQCLEHPHYESRANKKFLSDQSLPYDCFRLKHYAGSVSDKEQTRQCLNFGLFPQYYNFSIKIT